MISKKIIGLLKEDKSSKSKSFYLKNPYQKITKDFKNFLLNYSKDNKNCDIRICIHENSNSKHHDMLILHHKKNYYPPHLHKDFGDTYVLHTGKMGVFLFNKNGTIKHSAIINKNEMFKIPVNFFHAILPLTRKIIFYEFRTGPFNSKSKPILPKWAPSPKAPTKQINYYKKKLFLCLNINNDVIIKKFKKNNKQLNNVNKISKP